MNVKKFLLVILAFSLLSFSAAYGASTTITITDTKELTFTESIDVVSAEVSGDPDITTYTYILDTYQFSEIKDALTFANDPNTYLSVSNDETHTYVIDSDDEDKFANIAITLNIDDCLGGSIHFKDYPNIEEVSINSGGSRRTFSDPGDKHFYLDGSTTVTLENMELNGGSSNGGIEMTGGTGNFSTIDFNKNAGAVKISGGSATFTDCKFLDGTNGAVDISDCDDATFSNCKFSNNTSGNDGGAVNISGGSNIKFNDSCEFTGNKSDGRGGTINITAGEVSFTSSTFSNSHSSSDGGTVSIVGGNPVEFSSCKFENCSADGNGGAVYMSDGSVSFSGSNSFSNNSANNGGAMYVSGGSSLEFSSRTSFRNNTANTNGGALFINASSLTPDLSSITFTGNIASDGNGGALYLRSPATIGGTFSENYAKSSGGAVYINSSSSSVTINEVNFNTNSSDYNGGAMYINSPATFDEATFTENYATSNGGAIYIAGGNTITFGTDNSFTSNTVSSDGGAIYIDGGSDIAFSGSNTFETNKAENSAGAIFINRGSNITFTGANKFEANYSPNEGGAVTINSSGNIPSFTDVEFVNNSADNRGGTIFVSNGGAALNNLTSFATTSSDKGGAVYISAGTLNISSDVLFSDVSANDGGIIYMTGGTANIYAELKSVTANNNGGAIYMTGGTANLYGNISSNTAINNGGAICLSGDLPVVNVHSNLDGNNAVNGGAIYVQSGTVSISGDVGSGSDINITNNQASEYGGAIYINGSRAKLNIVGDRPVTFSNNKAELGGGAIYAYEGTVSNFTPLVTFSENYTTNGDGGALWLLTSTQVPNGKATFEKNLSQGGSGGAIYIGSTTNTNVTLNSATEYTFDGNIADKLGGAIHTVASTLTLDGFVIALENSAKEGGGFASSESGKIYITNRSSVSNQWAPTGGAFYAPDIYVTNSDLTSNHTEAVETSEVNGHGGGAIYATRHLEVTDGYFYNNYTLQQTEGKGGAIYVSGSSDDVKVTNSLFISNYTEKGNGGAILCENITGSIFENNTFTENRSGTDGGAIYIQGNDFNIKKCYFNNNISDNNGGALYFAQLTEGESPAVNVSYSMFTGNNAAGDQGGAAVIGTTNATIDSCTFTDNFLDVSKSSGKGFGGALYLLTRTSTENLSTVDSCTFYNNRIENADGSNSGGGALYVHCERSRIRSCTFTLNSVAGNGGGAIYLDSGTLSLAGIIAVGNTTIGLYDIRLHEGTPRIVSGGYNRVGKFCQGSGETDFKSVTGNLDSDRSSWLNKTWMTNKQSFFGKNELAVNRVNDSVPPSIGSTLGTGQVVLLTLMLSEDKTLPDEDRATNMIPYFRRGSFPDLDERGVTRARLGSDGQEIPLDIGALVFDGTNYGTHSDVTSTYSVASIQMSGLPNELRRVGQTVSLLAKVYYTNGREAYGGTGENEEPVKWSSDPSDYYVHVDENTGDLVVLRTTSSPESSTYVTITVETVRADSDGKTFKDSQYVKITDSDFTYLNTSPSYPVNYLRELINDFIEYNLGFGLADISTRSVTSSTFQVNFASIWNTVAYQVVDLTTTEPHLAIAGNYMASDGFVAAKGKGVNIDFGGREVGDILPVVYTWNFTGDELMKLRGYDLSTTALDDDTTLANDLFDVLKIDFQGAEGMLPVIGEEGVSAKDALDAGVMVLNNYDGSRGVQIELTAYVANVKASGESNGPQLIESDGSKLLVVPDGVPNDGKIYGTMWLAQDESKTPPTTDSTKTPTTKPATETSMTETGSNSASKSNSESDSGGGCNSLTAGGIAILMACLMLMKRK